MMALGFTQRQLRHWCQIPPHLDWSSYPAGSEDRELLWLVAQAFPNPTQASDADVFETAAWLVRSQMVDAWIRVRGSRVHVRRQASDRLRAAGDRITGRLN